MPSLDFLEAADGTPLTKAFIKSGETYDVTPYPHVRLFNSVRYFANNITEFHSILVEQALAQRCLLKGTLKDQLTAAPRMGMTEPMTPTHWPCFDLDFEDGWETVDDFLIDLDPALANVSYIFQHSASAGVTSKKGLRGHIFLLVDAGHLPSTYKMWLRGRNLAIPQLRDRIELSANGMALKWPLDITTCQNDKLIYIAPPTCTGFEDPIKERRIELVIKEQATATSLHTLDAMTPAAIEQETTQALNGLREALGLERAKPKFKTTRGIEYLANPEQSVITGVKEARGFIYLNLNGGDSWAYYLPDDNPEFVHNFKGEPIMRLRDIAPDFHDELRRTQIREAAANRDFVPLVFRDRERDAYYNALYYEHTDTVEYSRVSNIQKLSHFMLQYGETPPEIIEDWTVEFNPTTTQIIDVRGKWLNTFQPTSYLLEARSDSTSRRPPRIIERVLLSLCGSSQETLDHFLNWLAYIIQTRQKAGTAWIFHGVSGTGKGVLVSKVLKPILGQQHVVEYTTGQLEDNFNAGMETASILWIDEFHHESARSSGVVMNKLKNLITEDRIAIRAMRTDTVLSKSYLNIIIASNHPDPVRLAVHDRRFNVAPAQEVSLRLTEAEILDIENELPEFASYLMSYDVDTEQVRRVLLNDARASMITASQTSVERLFEAFRMGDLAYFLDFVSIKMPLQDTLIYNEFAVVIAVWARDAREGDMTVVGLADLRTVYQYIIGTPTSPAKLRRILAIYRLKFDPAYQGIVVGWGVEEDRLDAFDKAREKQLQTPNQQVLPGNVKAVPRTS